MIIREANVNDLMNLVKLEEENFISPWTEEQFKYELVENEFSKTLVIYDGDIFVGYLNYWLIFDRGEINKICIRKDYRRKGYAKELLDIAFKDFEENECLSVSLEVRVSNESAQKLYESYGFQTVVIKEAYYSDGEDAKYMIRGVF